jgi:hypothetical protein
MQVLRLLVAVLAEAWECLAVHLQVSEQPAWAAAEAAWVVVAAESRCLVVQASSAVRIQNPVNSYLRVGVFLCQRHPS